MSNRNRDKRNSGFSLVEALAATAILIVLLSLSAAAAAYYRDYLKITELDNAAREIYMAAENRAVLLNNGGQLDLVLPEDHALTLTSLSNGTDGSTAPEKLKTYYISEADSALNELLPSGTIDPALLEESSHFYIVYEQISGCVTDVFYAESPIDLLGEATFEDFYSSWTPPSASRDDRMRQEPMLGYYGGGMSGNTDYSPLPSPEVMVVIHNEERLTVDVTFQIPKAALDLMDSNWENNIRWTVKLEYLASDGSAGKAVTLYGEPETGAPLVAGRPMSVKGNLSSGSITYTWILDSLDYTLDESGSKQFNQRFCQLFGSGSAFYGGDFRVTAEIELSAKGHKSTSASGSDTNNSLFAESSGGEIARIEYLRHLQNLDQDFSMVSGKSAAVQIADIRCNGNPVYGEYEFIPIENPELTSYSGGWSGEELPGGQKRRNEIVNLCVTEESSDGKTAAGLFSTAADGTPAAPAAFSGIRLIDAAVTASKPAGALVGSAGKYVSFHDVKAVNAVVSTSGQSAGGIAGSAGDCAHFNGVHVVNSAVSSAQNSGGVAGYIQSSSTYDAVGFHNCRIYWEPEADEQNLRSLLGSDMASNPYKYQINGHYAGGLAGKLEANALSEITNCLSATMISGTTAGGLIGSVSGCVSAVIGGTSYYNYGSLKITGSYADCYLRGKYAAGLTGSLFADANISNCYTTGFIDMSHADRAAGLCLGGDAKLQTLNAYSAMYYAGRDSEKDYKNIIFELSQTQSNAYNDYFQNTYYLDVYLDNDAPIGSGTARATLKTYAEMTSQDFAPALGGSFAFKTGETNQETFPYNLQEHQNLAAYSFPGLNGLPHYGDWRAEFKEPSLVYYEQYSDGSYGFSGGNARYLIGQLENQAIRSDGYAVAVLQSDLDKANSFSVTYAYFDSAEQKKEIIESYSVSNLLQADWEKEEGGRKKTEHYYLIPLPETLVIGDLTSESFFQYLRFDFDRTTGSEEPPSGEYFYNPHFAETVKPYSPGNGKPLLNWNGDPDAEPSVPPLTDAEAADIIEDHISRQLIPSHGIVSVSVRTPRHFYDLSKYRDYYRNTAHSLAFQQTLDLDYGSYTGYGFSPDLNDSDPNKVPRLNGSAVQFPIGSLAAPFLGSYDGNCHSIQNVVFQMPKDDSSRVCAGLFGYSSGTLENIIYKMDPENALSVTFPSSEKETYLGALVGVNSAGTVRNCAAESVNLSSRVFDSHIYIGGLIGLNNGEIQNCAAELASVFVDASNYGEAYVGGLTGWNQSVLGVSASYAVGRVSAKAEEASAPVSLCGFAGRNSGVIRNSYAAMDLKPEGAGAAAYSFCGKSDGGGRQTGTWYLNQGNFTYRGASFAADYAPVSGEALPLRYMDLTSSGSVAGMSLLPQSADKTQKVFPYPTAVKNAAGNLIHYGEYPEPMELGEMGVYYWEELETGKKSTYHISVLAVDPAQRTVSRQSTLSTAHNDGGVVKRYGYGIYNKKGVDISLEASSILYSTDGEQAREFSNALFQELEAEKANHPDDPDKLADEQLALLMDGFDFHSFHSFGLNKALGGLYPDSDPETPNGTLTLKQSGAENISITFTLNPFFAGALSVEYPAVEPPGKQWGPKAVSGGAVSKDIPFETKTAPPGSQENPYGVRSIEQLELINWNSHNRDAHTVLELNKNKTTNPSPHDIGNFPYLSSETSTGKYYWMQSHDIRGAEGETYYPIAEFYDNTTSDANRGYLDGWFGGVYDGDSYVIENVDIQGQRASCAGLFGVVYNGTLQNIILYSSTGQSTVTSGFYNGEGLTGKPESVSQWYAIGALAGVAASHDENGKPGGSAILNCAVSGYNINAHTYTKKSQGGKAWGGTGVGGLLGLSNMALTNCTADTAITLADGSIAHDNMRVGGLAGSCQGSITNCYAGGTISVDAGVEVDDGPGIYIGGIVGGSYMKPLQVGVMGRDEDKLTIGFENDSDGPTSNTLTNCYSFVRLPDLENSHPDIKGLYALGGTGEINIGNYPNSAQNHGTSVKKNCYYLEDEVLYNNSRESILQKTKDPYFKTDLEYTAGVKYDKKEPFVKASVTNIRDAVTNVTQSIRSDGNYGVYYIRDHELGDGLLLFQFEGDYGTDCWTYKFLGWLVNYEQNRGRNTWDIVTDPNYLINGSSVSGVSGLTYEQLAGDKLIGSKTIYQLLNTQSGTDLSDGSAREKGPFRPVTTETDDGIPVPGKYSYPPDTSPALKGINYPFPTILTGEGGKYRVHYGSWPLNGIKRQNHSGEPLGGAPITTDLFVNSEYTEKLVLTESVAAGGTWSMSSGDESIAKPEIISPDAAKGEDPKSFTLKVTSQSTGTTTLNISYTVGGVTYPLSITVHVTADVELQPSNIFLFPSDEVTVKMKPGSKEGGLLDKNGALELNGDPISGNDRIVTQTVQPTEPDAKPSSILFTSKDAPTGSAMASVSFNYYAAPTGKPYPSVSPIRITVLELPEPVYGTSEDGKKTCTLTFSDLPINGETEGDGPADTLTFLISGAELKNRYELGAAAPDMETDGNAIKLTYPTDETPELELAVTLTASSLEHKLIPEEDTQTHTLTLTVQKPAGNPEGQADIQPIEALAPEDRQDTRQRKKRRKQKHRQEGGTR